METLLKIFIAFEVIYLNFCIVSSASISDKCVNGEVITNTSSDLRCQCAAGWIGTKCDICGGKARIQGPQGWIVDGPNKHNSWDTCAWVLNTSRPSQFVNFFIHSFSLECIWDHVMAFSESYFQRAALALSGDLNKTEELSIQTNEKGELFVTFISDANVENEGFNISFNVSPCPFNCSGRGQCLQGKCHCPDGFIGDHCHIPTSKCSNGLCTAPSSGQGIWWVRVSGHSELTARALHASVVVDDYLYLFGGYSHQGSNDQMLRLNLVLGHWEVLSTSEPRPPCLHGHSVVHWPAGQQLILFGGVFCSQLNFDDRLWSFSLVAPFGWRVVETQGRHPTPVTGHRAHLDASGEVMLVFFGADNRTEWFPLIQRVNLSSSTWLDPDTSTMAFIPGLVYAASTRTGDYLWFHGGLLGREISTSSNQEKQVTAFLYRYHLPSRTWSVMAPSPSALFSHSLVGLGGNLLAFGGCNLGSIGTIGVCISRHMYAYDPACDRWSEVSGTVWAGMKDYLELQRMGHSAHVWPSNGVMVVVAGFRGAFMDDVLFFRPGLCKVYTTQPACSGAVGGRRCRWSGAQCIEVDNLLQSIDSNNDCFANKSADLAHWTSQCARLGQSCEECSRLGGGGRCVWCPRAANANTTLCQAANESASRVCEKGIVEAGLCGDSCGVSVKNWSCEWCLSDPNCMVVTEEGKQRCVTKSNNSVKPGVCPLLCSSFNTCQQCTHAECIWCPTQQRCTHTGVYLALNNLGQCPKYTAKWFHCPADLECSQYTTCATCTDKIHCGWCEYPGGSGHGACYPGGLDGPYRTPAKGQYRHTRAPDLCKPYSHWFYIPTDCPKCQCNGHSECTPNGNSLSTKTSPPPVCNQPCRDHTEGDRCQQCTRLYNGTAKNGGMCTPCPCHGRAFDCDRSTGSCKDYCYTRGVVGLECNVCDKTMGFVSYEGQCYYDMKINFRYTMTPHQNRFEQYNKFINLIARPEYEDRVVEFTIDCKQSNANILFNFSFTKGYSPTPIPVTSSQICRGFEARLDNKKYYPLTNTTFLVYIYGFVYDEKNPFEIQVGFKQLPQLDLAHFFVTFFGCFLALLLIAAVIWRIKQKYDYYRRQQRNLAQQMKMAQRPFADITLLLDDCDPSSGPGVGSGGEASSRRSIDTSSGHPPLWRLSGRGSRSSGSTSAPTPANGNLQSSVIGIEPLGSGATGHVLTSSTGTSSGIPAIGTVFIQLPEGTPSGRLALGSALIGMQRSGRRAFEEMVHKNTTTSQAAQQAETLRQLRTAGLLADTDRPATRQHWLNPRQLFANARGQRRYNLRTNLTRV